MKALLIAVIVVALMVFFGWLTFTYVGDRPSVTFNTEQVQEDAGQIADTTKKAAGEAAEKGKELVDDVRRTDVNVDVDIDRKSPPK